MSLFHSSAVLPPPNLPLDNGMETGKTLEKVDATLNGDVANPVYGMRKSLTSYVRL